MIINDTDNQAPLVIDTSVTIPWFLDKPFRKHALKLAELTIPLYAPDVLLIEMASAAWQFAQKGIISYRQIENITSANMINSIHILASAPHIKAATQLALSIQYPVTECLYLASAKAISGRMVTTNARLLAAVKGTEADPFICHIQDVV